MISVQAVDGAPLVFTDGAASKTVGSAGMTIRETLPGRGQFVISSNRWPTAVPAVVIVSVAGDVVAGGLLDDAPANVVRLNYEAAPAENMAQSALGIVVGTAVAGTLSTTQMSTDIASGGTNHYNDRTVIWVTGSLAGQAARITAYDGVKVLTFTAVTIPVQAGDRFVIV